MMEGTLILHIPRGTAVLRSEKAIFYTIMSKLFHDPNSSHSYLHLKKRPSNILSKRTFSKPFLIIVKKK